MSEVPAGWYPVPDDPRTLRYWDGSTWTDHTHTFDEAVGLGSISQMISEGFNALGKYLQPVLVLSLLLLVVPNFLATYFTERALDGLTVVLPDDGDIDVIGFDSGDALLLTVFSLLPYFIATLHGLAITWLILRSEHQWGDGEESWSSALGPALRAAPRVVVVLFLVSAGAIVAIVAAVTIGVLVHPATLVLTIPAAIAFLLWLAVKVAPMQVAALAAPRRPLLPTSAGISEGRFGAVLGRLLVLAAVAFMLSLVTGIVSTAVAGVFGGGLEVDATDERLTFFGTSNAASLAVSAVIGAISNGIVAAFFASGLITIYRNAGGPFERSGHSVP